MVIVDCSTRLTPAKQKAVEPPAAAVSKKLKGHEISIEDVLSDESPYLEIHRFLKLPADQTVEEMRAASRPAPYNEIRCHENIVVELPNAFAKPEPKEYVPLDDGLDEPFHDEEEERNYHLFMKEYNESEGFDIEHYCYKIFGPIQPLTVDDNSEYMSIRECKPSVETAIQYVNFTTGSELELVRIIKCNYIRGTHYFATCEIKDTQTGLTHTYQIRVQRKHCTGKTTLHKFRKKLNE